MEEVIEMLTEDPEGTWTTAYIGASTTVSAVGLAYVGYKNDFGASGMTTNELDNYLEEHEGSLNPLAAYKRRIYSKEFEER